MNESVKKLNCPYCQENHVRRHGTTPKGSLRFRCLSCSKTWIHQDNPREKPDSDVLASLYLQGLSYRQLRTIYHMSPMRLNYRIRNFMQSCPSWEKYLDLCVDKQKYKVINLYGITLQASRKKNGSNNLYIALAVDAMATMVIGFEIGQSETESMWKKLLTRLKARGVTNSRFLFNLSNSNIRQSIQKIFPESSVKDFSFRFVYDKRLEERLDTPRGVEDIMDNTIINILSPFDFFSDGYLAIFKDPGMKSVLLDEREQVLQRLLVRIQSLDTTRLEGLILALEKRFKAFRFLKEDPRPIINGWIAWYMVQNLEIGYSRLSLYMQKPTVTSYAKFSRCQIPEPLVIDNQDRLIRFVVEIATRRLQLPLF